MHDREGHPAPQDLVNMLEEAGLIESAERDVYLELAEETLLREVAEREARVDSLTGLRNNRAFEEDRIVAAGRAERFGIPFSIASVDILDLSGWNDMNHALGDQALRNFARALDASAHRATDTVYRLSGDQFAGIFEGDSDTGKYLGEVSQRLETTEYRLAGKEIEFYPAFVRYVPEGRDVHPPVEAISQKVGEVFDEAQQQLSLVKADWKNGGKPIIDVGG